MAKMLRFDDMARLALKRGVDQVADAVRVTLGPRGRNVIVHGTNGTPVLTNDGITIARRIELQDPYENLGAQLLREVASKTQEVAGDGTTTSTLLAQAIVSSGLLAVNAGNSPVRLRRGIEKAVDQVVSELRRSAEPIQGREALVRVASLSAHHDDVLGALVADALLEVGPDGVVRVEEGRATEDRVRWERGLQIDRGYLSPYFVTEPETMEAVLSDPWVLLCEDKIDDLGPLVPVLESAAQAGASLLLVADDVAGEILATLVMNRLRGTLEVAAVQAPAFGERRRELLEDLSAFLGGRVVSDGAGRGRGSVGPEDLGRAERVVLTRDAATFLGGQGTREALGARVREIEAGIGSAGADYERERLRERLARLRGRVAVLEVGAPTPLERAERRGRATDALAATRAAMEEGVVPGGGVALLRAAANLRSLRPSCEEEKVGIGIVEEALGAPLRTLAENAGYDGPAVLEEVREAGGDHGFDVETGLFGSMTDAGILDALKVVRAGLQNAASIGSLILTTETLVADQPGDEDTRRKEA